ncbi:MAG: flagellar export chaperone FlgN [Tissierellaceae bacterium]|nr:flagellar export chaperone FlgN [Tissierellaceae bacterium]
MTENNINKMIKLSMDKKNKLVEILDFTNVQEKAIKEDNTEELSKILVQKDRLMKSVDDLDKEFVSLYERVKAEENVDNFRDIDVTKYESLKGLKDVVEEINRILDKLTQLDKRNMENMKDSLNKTKSDLKQVKEVQRAYKGYSYEESGSILIDKKK